MQRLLLILLFLSPLLAAGQGNPIAQFNSEAFWQKCKQVKHLPASPISDKDTAMVVVSNRKPSGDPVRYMTEKRDDDVVHYFFVFTRNASWNVLEVESLEKAIQYMPARNRDWVLYTEGMGKLFTTDVYRGISLAGEYGVNVIMFDYPSITTTKKTLGNYFFSISNARIAYIDFVPVIEKVKQLRNDNKMGSGKLSIFFHSMGNHIMRQTVKHHRLENINNTIWVDNLILNAPCVPRRGHKKWIDKINFAKKIYINYNNEDFTLGVAYYANKKIQLGQKPVRNISDKAVYINFNAVCQNGHSNFLSVIGREAAKPAALAYYNTILHGDTVNVYNTKQFSISTFKKIGWELLP